MKNQIGKNVKTYQNVLCRNSKIGKYCSISWNVSIGGANHEYKRLTTHPFPYDSKYGIVDSPIEGAYPALKESLEIENDVWIAANACIMRGVSISNGAVIGANAVITKDVAPYEIWAGVPGKKIGQRFTDEIISELLDLKWWDLEEEILKRHISLFRECVTLENIKNITNKLRVTD